MFIAFVVILLGVSFLIEYKKKFQVKDFYIDRKLNRYIISISAGATANTGFIVTGAVGLGFTLGISSLLLPLSWFLGELLFWQLFPRKINTLSTNNNLTTISQFLSYDLKNNKKALQLFSSILLIFATITYAIAQWKASSVTFTGFYDISTTQGILLSGIIVTIYCSFTGFRSSVIANVILGVFMILLTTVLLVFCMYKIGGFANLGNNSIFNQVGYSNIFFGMTFWSAIAFIIGWAFAGTGFGLSQPQIIDKYFAGRDETEIKKAKWFYLSFVQYTWVGMTFLGVLIKILISDLSDSEAALPRLVSEYSNQPIKGIIVIGVFATIASTAASLIISIANSIHNDILKVILPRLVFPKYFDRLLTIIVSFLTIILATLFVQYSVYDLAVFAILLAAIISPAMIIKLFKIPNNSLSLIMCLLSALIAALTWKYFKLDSVMNQAIIGIITGLTFNYLIYKLTKTKSEEIR